MVKKIICILSILIILTSGIVADERPKVGLVLAGGGALGFAHIGVLKVLEDNGIPIDYIAGTSMGGIVGALSAYGYTAREIEKEVNAVDWIELFFDKKNRDFMSYSNKTANSRYFMTLGFDRHGINNGQGIISGQKIQNLFYRLVGPCSDKDNFDLLPTPFRAVATDILTGEEVILKDGSLADAMRSTMSIPGVFTPVERDGHLLVDGMVSNNLPVHVAREMGADIIIAVTLSQNNADMEELKGPAGVASQMLNLYIYDQVQLQLQDADVIVAPDIKGYSSTSYFNFKEIVAIGEEAALEVLSQIKEKVGPDNLGYYSKLKIMKKNLKIIDSIEISNLDNYELSVFEKRLGAFIGKPLDVDAMNEIIQDFHSSGLYDSIRYYIDTVGNKNVLYVNVEPSKKGPHFFRTGLFYELNTNVHEDYIFNFLFALEFNNLLFPGDRLENEFAVFSGVFAETRYFVPFMGHFFVRPEVEVNYIPEENEYLGAGYSLEKTEFSVSSSISIGTFSRSIGEMSVGFMNQYIYYDYNMVNIAEADNDGFVNSFFFRSRLDNIDSVVLPEKGSFLELMFKYSDSRFGSDVSYTKAKASFWQYFQFLQRNSIGAKVFACMDFATDLPFFDAEWFSYINAFPGYSNKEFTPDNVLGAVVDYKFKLMDLRMAPNTGRLLLTLRGGFATAYEDFDLFAGQSTDSIYGVGVGLGLTNVNIPIWLECAWNDDGRFMFHISAGNKF